MSVTQIYQAFLQTNPALSGLPVMAAHELLLACVKGGGKLLVCGNGGSAADAEHIVGELMKGFLRKRELTEADTAAFRDIEGGETIAKKLQKGIPAISLCSHTALMTAVGNDTEYDMVFAQQVYGCGKAGDVLLAMTTSGNSQNVVNAAKTAKAIGMQVIGITGESGSQLSACSDLCLQMPSSETYRVQEFTLPTYHALCAMLEDALFGEAEQ